METSSFKHHGVKGQHWGIRNGPPYPVTNNNSTVFISGSSKTQDKTSGYYRKSLPKDIKSELNQYMKDNKTIVVGDAPGIDRQVQNYLKKNSYGNVEIYGPGKKVRYQADKKWKSNPIDAPEFDEYSPEWLRKKDIAMTNRSTEGLAVILDEGAKATRNNVDRLLSQNKKVKVYELSSKGKEADRFVNEWIYQNKNVKL